MIDCTSCYLLRGNPPTEVLLGYKKTGFGAGYYAGVGGKVYPEESLTAAAIRELKEETSMKANENDLIPMGKIEFLFPYKPDWDLRMHVYLVREWSGEPIESREINPAWYSIKAIPYNRMWADAMHWMPYVLEFRRTEMVFTFAKDNTRLSRIDFIRVS
jgi:8-oxo-dGTP diphosphatase